MHVCVLMDCNKSLAKHQRGPTEVNVQFLKPKELLQAQGMCYHFTFVTGYDCIRVFHSCLSIFSWIVANCACSMFVPGTNMKESGRS